MQAQFSPGCNQGFIFFMEIFKNHLAAKEKKQPNKKPGVFFALHQ